MKKVIIIIFTYFDLTIVVLKCILDTLEIENIPYFDLTIVVLKCF